MRESGAVTVFCRTWWLLFLLGKCSGRVTLEKHNFCHNLYMTSKFFFLKEFQFITFDSDDSILSSSKYQSVFGIREN